jgi:hypothetical protein
LRVDVISGAAMQPMSGEAKAAVLSQPLSFAALGKLWRAKHSLNRARCGLCEE